MHHRNLMGSRIFRKKRFRLAGILILLAGAVVIRGWLVRDTPSDDVYIDKPLYSPDGKIHGGRVFREWGRWHLAVLL